MSPLEPPLVAKARPDGSNEMLATGAAATRIGRPISAPVLGVQSWTIPAQVPVARVPFG
jgi:hypothetical protein